VLLIVVVAAATYFVLSGRLSDTRLELSGTALRLEEANGTIVERDQNISSLNARITGLTGQVSQLTGRANRLETRVENLRASKKGLQSSLKICRDALDQFEELHALSVEIFNDFVVALNAAFAGDFITSDFYIAQVESQIDQHDAELGKAGADLSACEAGLG
jgi:chromosome segregation ATPase